MSVGAAAVAVVGAREAGRMLDWSHLRATPAPARSDDSVTGDGGPGHDGAETSDEAAPSIGPGTFLRNVVTGQVTAAATVLAVGVVLGVHGGVLGVVQPTPAALAGAVGLGVGMYLLTEVAIAGVTLAGLDYDETFRAAAAPATTGGWLLLVGVTLPLVSVGEEVLFRGALLGAVAAVGVPVPVAVVASTAVFALVHRTGAGGMVVAGVLGAVLAVAFVATGSLVVVVVAHTLVNATEFAVHEGVGRHPDRLLVGVVAGA